MFNNRSFRAGPPSESLAREIAARSIEPTLDAVGAAAEDMSAAELRGYVRALAMPHVREEAFQLVSREWPGDALNELVESALEFVTHQVIQQVQAPIIVAMPAPHVRLRSAA